MIPKDYFTGCEKQRSLQKLLGEQGLRHPNSDFADFKKKLKDQPEIIDQRLETELVDQSEEDPFIKHDQDYDTRLRRRSLAKIKIKDSVDAGSNGFLIDSLILKKIENHYESHRNHVSMTKISGKPHNPTHPRTTPAHHQTSFSNFYLPRPYSPAFKEKLDILGDLIGYKDKIQIADVSTFQIPNNKQIYSKAQNLLQYTPDSKFLQEDVNFDFSQQKKYLKANKEKKFQYVGRNG